VIAESSALPIKDRRDLKVAFDLRSQAPGEGPSSQTGYSLYRVDASEIKDLSLVAALRLEASKT